MKWAKVGDAEYTAGRYRIEKVGPKNWELLVNGTDVWGPYPTSHAAQAAAVNLEVNWLAEAEINRQEAEVDPWGPYWL